MRPTEFSNDEIIQAGQELLAAGRNITGFALRKVVGGGAASRLKQVWDEHINSSAVTKAEPVAELPLEVADELKALTTSLVERITTMAVALNDKAVRAAERRVSELVRSAGEQREQAERELADASTAVDELEEQLSAAAQDKELLRVKLDEAAASSQKQAVEIAQLTERLAATDKTAKAAAEHHSKVVDALEAESAQHQELSKAQADAIDQVKSELATAKGNAAAAAQVHAEQLRAAEAKLASTAGDAAAARERAEKAELARGEAREDAAKLAGQVSALESQLAMLQGLLEKLAPNVSS